MVLRQVLTACFVSGLMLFVADIRVSANKVMPPNESSEILQVTQQPIEVVEAIPTITPTGLSQINQFDTTSPTPFPTPIVQEQLKKSKIVFQIDVINCKPWDWCTAKPQLHFMAQEYMSGSHVIQVFLRIGDREKLYNGSDALLTLPETGEQGAWIYYWAISSHDNDQSQTFRLKYRYVHSATEAGLFRFDLLESNWADQAPSGSLVWGLFPPLNQSMSKALDQPLSAKYLYTTNRYIYLAGHLIQSGLVNATACPNNGLYANGSATECGEKAGADQVLAWQNKYDEQIYAAALKYNIPARILKGILAQETQFWPSSDNPYELGLGKFTENGADLLLMWNVNYFLSVCIPVYGSDTCSAGYSTLEPTARLMLRRALLDKIGTASEIDLLAATLYASAAQINQMVINTSGKEPAELTTYEIMWKISTGNYYAGSGCIGGALQKINDGALQLTWEEVGAQMSGDCKIATDYVRNVFGASE